MRKQLVLFCQALALMTVFMVERSQYPFVAGLPTTITHDLVQETDGVPVLGRGYSLTTNSFQASCFDVNGTTVEHSYNYDCESLSLSLL